MQFTNEEHLNHYFHLHFCPSVRSLVTLQRYITLIAPSALSRALPNLECIRAADNFLVSVEMAFKLLPDMWKIFLDLGSLWSFFEKLVLLEKF